MPQSNHQVWTYLSDPRLILHPQIMMHRARIQNTDCHSFLRSTEANMHNIGTKLGMCAQANTHLRVCA